ncbi:mycofactocin-coupled SDR family oxidoreductase [Fodinicola acaciae]|uniref:mycofactocin-coupled SDR family oxidoreductase n=1 Tax=Fodinicola acaciae TaxID=2681555 RepID=UPI0013D062E1|nr:mycofactocin-coupled SDR family oxidoreductase [Fodinicola acaciae]
MAKVALITGAARGQGRGHAVTLASEGVDIIAVDICAPVASMGYPLAGKEDLDQTVRAVEALGRRCVPVVADVRDGAALADAAGLLGRLDIVVANAGIGGAWEWDQVTPEIWRDVIDINLTGVWNTCVAAAPHLIAGGGGSVIIISSTAGLKGQPFLAPYVAAKSGIVGLARSLANEWAEHHIRVNTIHPAGVETGMSAGFATLQSLIDKHPHTGPIFVNALDVEVVEISDVSAAVAYLASDAARYVTGTELKVDAGNTIR